jgi:hypothetical protein
MAGFGREADDTIADVCRVWADETPALEIVTEGSRRSGYLTRW